MRKFFLHFSVFIFVFMALVPMKPKPASACCTCTGRIITEIEPFGIIPPIPFGPLAPRVQSFVDTELSAQRAWLISIFWEDNVLPALMMMADQLTAVAVQQAQIIGTFIDAKHQMETQQVIQRLRAEAHKDYHPSTGVCEFGSTTKSLAVSERQGEFNAIVLSQRQLDRHLGSANTAAAPGGDRDKESRLAQFSETYCDSADNNSGLDFLCDITIGGTLLGRDRRNKDIDFARTVQYPWTLGVDFTNDRLSDDEEDIMALSSNLYGHEVFNRIPGGKLGDTPEAGQMISDLQRYFIDMRSITAKRSVAENSFNAIIGMKSEARGLFDAGLPGTQVGGPAAADFMRPILEELGVEPDEVDGLMGEFPSYYAQMEVLTKKIYQNPGFYTNLYDKPANVTRKGVAIQAIALMQKFDLFKSYLRQEASLSVLLELAVMDLQQEVESQIRDAVATGDVAE